MRCALLLLIIAAHGLVAQEPLCLLKRFGVEEGLLNRRVNAIAQDRDGFLWIATPGGLHRFDGYVFKSYTTADGLASNAVDDIWMDAEGLLWLVRGGTRADLQAVSIDIIEPHTGRIRSFDERFGAAAPMRAVDLLPQACRMDDGTLVLSATGRLIRYHPGKGFTEAPIEGGLEFLPHEALMDGGVWGTGIKPGPAPATVVRVGKDGGSAEPSVAGAEVRWSIVGNSSRFGAPFGTHGRYLRVVEGTGQGRECWLSPAGSIITVNREQREEEWQGQIRMPLGDDLWLVDGTVRHMRAGDDPLSAPIVFDLADRIPDVVFRLFSALRDRTGHIWIGGEFGLYRLEVRPNPFQRWLWSTTIPRGHGVRIRGMAVLDGSLHVNSEQEGRWQLDARTGAIISADTTRTFRYALASDAEGGIWVAEGDSLIHCNATGKTLEPGIDISGHSVWSVLPMDANGLLIGTTTGLGWADRTFHRYTPMNTAPGGVPAGSTVVDLVRDRAGAIWVSTDMGLFNTDATGQVTARWWNGARSAGDSTHYLPASDFRHFRQDRDGIIWLSTADAGLLRWDRATGEVRAISRREGLASNSVYASYADDLGQIWLPTDNGIARYDPASGLVTNYTTDDGITHNEFNRLAHTQGPDGRLYFGGLNGITAFDPRTLRGLHPGREAPLVITDVRQYVAATDRLEDRMAAVTEGTGIVMEPDDRYFTVSMALLSYEDPGRISYAWRIDGVDPDWNYQHEPSLRIAALPFGDHVLRIKAQGGDGVWTGELSIPILFAHPLYLKWWFVTLCILALAAMIFWVVRSRMRSERTRIIGDDDPR